MILIVFLVLVLVITGLYQTFSLYTSSEGLSIIDGIKTYQFILNANNTTNSVIIASGTSKNIAITVTNQEKIKLLYGIYYTASDDLSNVELGYKWNTEHLPNGVIESNQDYMITIQIDNNSSNNITIQFGIHYGLENGGDLALNDNEHWLEKKWNFPLSDVDFGSYVRYVGNNGCTVGTSCLGQNANFVSDTDKGYCANGTLKYRYDGWRIAYSKGDSAYLISGGSPECLCTNSDGTSSATSCTSYDTTADLSKHFANLNVASLKYCDDSVAYNHVCDSSSAWNLNANDFYNMLHTSIDSCTHLPDNPSCGYQNPVIDNGGLYWMAAPANIPFVKTWYPYAGNVGSNFWGGANSSVAHGVRPIIRLDSAVKVVGGEGTYEDPYRIRTLKLSEERAVLADVGGRIFTKYDNNSAFAAMAYFSTSSGDWFAPVLVSTIESAVAYDTNHSGTTTFTSSGNITYKGEQYYVSSGAYWMSSTSTYSTNLEILNTINTPYSTVPEAANALLDLYYQ